jgi:hypothetical protein
MNINQYIRLNAAEAEVLQSVKAFLADVNDKMLPANRQYDVERFRKGIIVITEVITDGTTFQRLILGDDTGQPRFADRPLMFVDRYTGDVYKPANANQPAAGTRGNVLTAEGRRMLVAEFEPTGRFLYNYGRETRLPNVPVVRLPDGEQVF